MLRYVSVNLFGPAFVLMIHYEYFLKVLRRHAGKALADRISQGEALTFIGGILDDTLNFDLTPSSRPQLVKVDGKHIIRQPANNIFYSSTTNMVMDWAIAFVLEDGKTVPVLVKLR